MLDRAQVRTWKQCEEKAAGNIYIRRWRDGTTAQRKAGTKEGWMNSGQNKGKGRK
jgi:hypothetical protein